IPDSAFCILPSAFFLLFSLDLSALDTGAAGQAINGDQAVIVGGVAEGALAYLRRRFDGDLGVGVARVIHAPLRQRDQLRLAAQAGHELARAVKLDIRQRDVGPRTRNRLGCLRGEWHTGGVIETVNLVGDNTVGHYLQDERRRGSKGGGRGGLDRKSVV